MRADLSSPRLFADEDYMRRLFDAEVLSKGDPRQLLGVTARILRKYLRKTVVHYTLEFDNSSTATYIGLHRESDEGLRKTYSVLKLLWSNGFGETGDLRVPRPVLYVPSMCFLLMDEAKGKTLRTVFENQEDGLEQFVEGAARWLAKLHRSEVRLDGVRSRSDEIAASLRFMRAALWLFPALYSKIHLVSQQLINAQESLRHSEARPIHGDYHPRNIIASSDKTTVIDFEEAGMGEPAFDLGYFVAQTKMTHGIGPTTARIADKFVHEYEKHVQLFEDDFEQRVKIFEAQTYFQRIYHTHYLLGLKPDFNLISKWLAETESCLETGA